MCTKFRRVQHKVELMWSSTLSSANDSTLSHGHLISRNIRCLTRLDVSPAVLAHDP